MKRNSAKKPVGSRAPLVVRIFPNNEAVVYRQSIKKAKPVSKYDDWLESSWLWKAWKLYLDVPAALAAFSLFMGLSLVENFDKLAKPLRAEGPDEEKTEEEELGCNQDELVDDVLPPVKVRARTGSNGISRGGARKVRGAAYLMQKRFGAGRLTFATVTVPDFPVKKLRLIHENWNKVVEIYRLYISRHLKNEGLSGDIITVSEIQTERQKKTGMPLLHLHSLWVGRLPYGGWAISTELHDKVWRQAISIVVPTVGVSFKSAANLQEVESSASGYLGKYMSKGAASVKLLKDEGFIEWLPRQWWNMSRNLSTWFEKETITSQDFGEFLFAASDGESKGIWEFVAHVQIDLEEIKQYWVATYGRLNIMLADKIRQYESLRRLDTRVTLLT